MKKIKLKGELDLLDYIEKLQKKCKYGEKIKKLSNEEIVIYLVSELESEVNNGGFDQFFINSSGRFSTQTIECLKAINANYTADLLREALDTVKTAKTEDDLPRIEAHLNQLDDKFYEYTDNLEELQMEYIRNNILN